MKFKLILLITSLLLFAKLDSRCQIDSTSFMLSNTFEIEFDKNKPKDTSNFPPETENSIEFNNSVQFSYLLNQRSFIGIHISNEYRKFGMLSSYMAPTTGGFSVTYTNSNYIRIINMFGGGISYGRLIEVKKVVLIPEIFIGLEKTKITNDIVGFFDIDQIYSSSSLSCVEINSTLSTSIIYKLNNWLGLKLKFFNIRISTEIHKSSFNKSIENFPIVDNSHELLGHSSDDLSIDLNPKTWEYGFIFFINRKSKKDITENL